MSLPGSVSRSTNSDLSGKATIRPSTVNIGMVLISSGGTVGRADSGTNGAKVGLGAQALIVIRQRGITTRQLCSECIYYPDQSAHAIS